MHSVRPSLIALLLAAGLAPLASAQTLLPPPPARPEPPEYVPPSKRPQRPAPAAHPTRQAQPAQTTRPAFDPTTVGFTPIWTTGEDGSIQGPSEYYEIAAIRNNPLVDPDVLDIIDALLEDRAREMELVALSNARVCVDALTAVIPGFDVSDESTRTPLGVVATALAQPGGLVGYLAEQGLLSPEMSQMSNFIGMNYTQALLAEVLTSAPEGASQDEITTLQSQFLIRHGLSEPLLGFGRLARRAIEADPSLAQNPDELLALEGDAFVDAAAYALAHLSDDELKRTLTQAYESVHGPAGN